MTSELFNRRSVAKLAFEVLENPSKITCRPKKLTAAAVGALRWVLPVKAYGPIQFLATVMTLDVVGKTFGQRRLVDHFRRCSRAGAQKTPDEARRSLGLTKHQPY